MSVSQQSQELAVVVPSLFFLMNSCVCRVLHDHTKCGFVLFCGFENICKWCGLEQTRGKAELTLFRNGLEPYSCEAGERGRV